MIKNTLKVIILFLVFFNITSVVFADNVGYVRDASGVLNAEQESLLESKIENYKQESGHEIGVYIVQSLEGRDIEGETTKVFRELGVGDKEKNNGVLFFISIDDRKMRIEVGYGLEGELTDTETKHIQDEIARPAFRENKYFEGIESVVKAIIENIKIEGNYASNKKESNFNLSGNFIEILLFFFFIFAELIFIYFAKTKSWWQGAVLGGILGGVFYFFVASLIFSLIIFIVITFIDYYASKKGVHGTRSFINFFSGGSGRGGFGGGGFGGGSSGGGGSISSW